MNIYTRPTLTALPPSIHGARDYTELARLGINPDAVIDFSDNSNPYGPHPAVLEAVSAAVNTPTVARYPDRDCLALRQAMANEEHTPTTCLLPTNGASELIQLIALAFVEPGSRHLILAPTFGEYSRAIQLMGGKIHEHRPGSENPTLRFNADAVAAAIRTLQPNGIWLCNPNNPTGQQWSAAELSCLRAADPDNQALWVIDESYRYFTVNQNSGGGMSQTKNTIIIRSLTKEYGLAGLRLGYAVAAPALIAALQAVQPPWSVNSLAQVAGVAALQPEIVIWREQSMAQLHQHAAGLWQNLSTMGLDVLPTSTAYTLINVGDAAQFRRSLLNHGLLVRDCASFGLPKHIRIAVQLPAENEKLLTAVRGMRPRF